MTIPLEILLFAFAFGLCIGSFLNVCIYRLPESMSIIRPPSSCPQCKNPIRFYDNVPVISYLLLRGRCRNCQTPISIRYPLIELLTGLCAAGVVLKFGLTLESLIYFTFVATLITITFIDIDHQIIPDVISLPGIVLFFIASFGVPAVTVKEAVIGILIGGGSLYVVALAYALIKKREGMGGGDIKLLAMIGALLGWQGVLFTLFVSSLVGTITGILVMLRKGGNMRLAIPFGPFLSIGAVLYVFYGPAIVRWYLTLNR